MIKLCHDVKFNTVPIGQKRKKHTGCILRLEKDWVQVLAKHIDWCTVMRNQCNQLHTQYVSVVLKLFIEANRITRLDNLF